MKTHRTIRYRLYPATQAKHQQLHGTAGACRYVWNHFVAQLRNEYQTCGKCEFSYYALGKQFTLLRRHGDQWLQDYSAYIVKSSLQPIEQTYRGFFNGTNALPKFHGKHTHSPTFPINYQSAKVASSHLYIQKVGWMKFAGGDRYKGEKFVSGQVRYECGKWYALCYEVAVADKANRKTQSKFKCQYCGHEDNADVNAALNILAAGHTATGCGGSGVARPMKRQEMR